MRIRELGSRPAPAAIRDFLSRVARGRAPVISVLRREIAYWQERGWTRDGKTYTGTYQTPYAAFPGWIEDHRSYADFYIHNPSAQIRHDAHWACFLPRGNEWFLVHMGRRPKDIGSGIMTIERMITEAYKR